MYEESSSKPVIGDFNSSIWEVWLLDVKVKSLILELSNGKIFTTMEWSMVFVKVPLYSMVFQWFFYMLTIGASGFSMDFQI